MDPLDAVGDSLRRCSRQFGSGPQKGCASSSPALELMSHSLRKACGSKGGARAEKPPDIGMRPGEAAMGGGIVLTTHLSRSLMMLPREVRSIFLAALRCASSLASLESTH